MRPEQVGLPKPEQVARILPEHLVSRALNLVVFGPGRGESMVLVLPDGTVGVVDGCRERGDPVPQLLEALEKQSAPRKEEFRIGFICLTHPHDDHYAGLGNLLRAYQGRVQAVWSAPKVGDRYAKALLDYVVSTRAGREPLPDNIDVGSLERLISEMTAAHEKYRSNFRHVTEGKSLFVGSAGGHPLSVTACGPADVDVDNAHLALVEGVSELFTQGEHSSRFDPNATSGALMVRWGKAGMLLGGDLLCAKGRYRGWDAVAGDIHPPVQVIKVAHHASEEAHHEVLWSRLGASLAIVTPFKEAVGSMPPRPEQVAMLAQQAVVAITAVPRWGKSARNPKPVYSASTSTTAVRSARNTVLKLAPKPGEDDTCNAVSVSLDATGKVLRFVLAGKANVYEPPAAAPRLRSA